MNGTKRGLYTCRYTNNGGQLARSVSLCRSLVNQFEIDFLVGSDELLPSFRAPQLRSFVVPQLGQAEIAGLADKSQRRLPLPHLLIEHLNEPYDFFMTDLFPFGRWEVAEEVAGLIQQLKRCNPACLILCSLKESFAFRPMLHDGRVVEFLKKHYDHILVHADPAFYHLEDSFNFAGKVADRIIYTGYITHPDLGEVERSRQNKVIVTPGAASTTEQMFYALIEAAPAFPHYRFCLMAGPKIASNVLSECRMAAQKVGAHNVEFVMNWRDYSTHLAESIFSISAGVNATIDAIMAGIPAIVIPSLSQDHPIIASRLAAAGYVKLLNADEINSERLGSMIHEALASGLPTTRLNLAGAQNSCREIHERLFVHQR